TTYTLDGNGFLTKQQTAEGAVRRWGRGPDELVRVASDPLSRATVYNYNSGGDLTQVNYPDGSTAKYQYDGTLHKVTLATDGNGNQPQYTYNPQGDVLTRTDGENKTTTYAYSTFPPSGAPNGLLSSVTDPLPPPASYAYDSNRRQTLASDPLGNST